MTPLLSLAQALVFLLPPNLCWGNDPAESQISHIIRKKALLEEEGRRGLTQIAGELGHPVDVNQPYVSVSEQVGTDFVYSPRVLDEMIGKIIKLASLTRDQERELRNQLREIAKSQPTFDPRLRNCRICDGDIRIEDRMRRLAQDAAFYLAKAMESDGTASASRFSSRSLQIMIEAYLTAGKFSGDQTTHYAQAYLSRFLAAHTAVLLSVVPFLIAGDKGLILMMFLLQPPAQLALMQLSNRVRKRLYRDARPMWPQAYATLPEQPSFYPDVLRARVIRKDLPGVINSFWTAFKHAFEVSPQLTAEITDLSQEDIETWFIEKTRSLAATRPSDHLTSACSRLLQ